MIYSSVCENHGFVTAKKTVRTLLINKTSVSDTSAYSTVLLFYAFYCIVERSGLDYIAKSVVLNVYFKLRRIESDSTSRVNC